MMREVRPAKCFLIFIFSLMIVTVLCGDTFMTYVDMKISESPFISQMTGVSDVQCAYSCFAAGSCCVVGYKESIKTCVIDNSFNCCPANETSIGWTVLLRSTFVPPRDCGDLKGGSGVYTISPFGEKCGFDVYCDMDTDGGGWTVFQRRLDGTLDFYLGWSEYEKGFGDMWKEFWLGNERLHKMTSQYVYTLRINLEDFENETRYAAYRSFFIGDATSKYRLQVSGYHGDAGDGLAHSNGSKFTTKDQDNDIWHEGQCAQEFKGAWWYRDCHRSNLNGLYLGGVHTTFADGIEWKAWRGTYYSLKSTKMMIRRN